MAVKWSGNTPEQLVAKIAAQGARLEEQAFDIVRETAAEAAIEQAEILEAAHTATGLARAANPASGGSISPGRIESGLMINTITSHATKDGNVYRGEWGWDDPEEYFAAQDLGVDGRIEAAGSLLGSFISARERLDARVRAAVRD